MANSTEITKAHFNVALSIISAFWLILIGLVGYIWLDHKAQQRDLFDKLIQVTDRNTISIDAMKKYVLLRDGIDLDKVIDQSTWDQLIKDFKTKPRGINYNSIKKNNDTQLSQR